MITRGTRTSAVERGGTRVVFRGVSRVSGELRVIDRGDHRHLIVNGDTLSAIPLSDNWSRVDREYWARALQLSALPRRPTALFVGAGGGTQLVLLARRARPRWITVVERDPLILRVAQRYFGLGRIERAEFLCGDIARVLPSLETARRRFDFIMEDALYAEPLDRALPVLVRLGALLGRGGALVSNRHADGNATALATALRQHFARVSVRRVRRDRGNALITATGPQPPSQGAGARVFAQRYR